MTSPAKTLYDCAKCDSCTDLTPMTFALVPAVGDFRDAILDGPKVIGTKPGKRFHMRASRGASVVFNSVPLHEKNAQTFGEKYCTAKNASAGLSS